jgi:hypothetical protein
MKCRATASRASRIAAHATSDLLSGRNKKDRQHMCLKAGSAQYTIHLAWSNFSTMTTCLRCTAALHCHGGRVWAGADIVWINPHFTCMSWTAARTFPRNICKHKTNGYIFSWGVLLQGDFLGRTGSSAQTTGQQPGKTVITGSNPSESEY